MYMCMCVCVLCKEIYNHTYLIVHFFLHHTHKRRLDIYDITKKMFK